MGNKNKTYLFMKGGNKKLGKTVLTGGGSIKNVQPTKTSL